MTNLDEAVHALRTATAMSDMDHVVALRITGADGFAELDALVPADLYLRDGQVLQSLLLEDDGRPFADVYVARDDEDLLLLSEGPGAPELVAWLEDRMRPDARAAVVDLSATHRMISLHGPYAWELLGAWVGEEVVGLPYLSLFAVAHGSCVRAGKTGEYGYDLLLERDRVDAARAELRAIGAAFDLAEVGLDALDRCALENCFFDVRAGSLAGLTPVELQLSWRLSSTKTYPGSAAVRARRGAARLRTTAFVSEGEVRPGDEVWLDDRCIGKVRLAACSPTRGDLVGQALLALAYAEAGVDRYVVHRGPSEVPIRTVSAPFVNNRSLYVDPQRHAYRFREEEIFPSLVPEAVPCR